MNMMHTSGNTTAAISMVFSSWDTYRLQLLFSSWKIETPWQFVLSWFAVAFSVIVWHFLECTIHSLDQGIVTFLVQTNPLPEGQEVEQLYKLTQFRGTRPRAKRPIGWLLMKIFRGFLQACKYTLSIFLMLVGMSFNPSLMLALFVGYWVGDIVFVDLRIDLEMQACRPLFKGGGIVGLLMRWILCAPMGQVFHYQIFEDEAIEFSLGDTPKERLANTLNTKRFIIGLVSRTVSLIVLVLTLVWVVTVEGGFGYTPTTEFGWHALCMTLFTAVFTNEALLTYKAPLLPQLANNRLFLR